MWEAVGRRLRRNFLWIYLILGITWIAKVTLLTESVSTWDAFFANAAIGGIPGEAVFLAGLVFYCGIFLAALLTRGLVQATGEILPRYPADLRGVPLMNGRDTLKEPPWFRFGKRRRQFVAWIITDQGQAVGEKILKEMQRGVTALSGRGMYTGKSHEVLICALTLTEVNQLKNLVKEADPKAFVIVMPAHEVLGMGFMPLEIEKDK
jgi:uncharacterized membrane-anchored protein YitT (DUF2179 family)